MKHTRWGGGGGEIPQKPKVLNLLTHLIYSPPTLTYLKSFNLAVFFKFMENPQLIPYYTIFFYKQLGISASTGVA